MAGLPGVGPSLRQPRASASGSQAKSSVGPASSIAADVVRECPEEGIKDACADRRVDVAGDDDRHPGLDQHRGERSQLGVDRRVAEERFERERDGHRHGTAAYGRLLGASNLSTE